MASLNATSNANDPLMTPMLLLAQDLLAMKFYWAAISAVWVYDYFITLDDEVEYAWSGKKTPVFWLYFSNRYLAPCFIIITLVAYFLPSFTSNICASYGFMETLETMIMTFVAEAVLTLRVYALSKRNRIVLFIAAVIIIWQWAICIYVMSQSSQGSSQVALLLPMKRAGLPPLPQTPEADEFHICIFISVLSLTPWVEAWLSLSIAFDTLAFLAITTIVMIAAKNHRIFKVMKIMQRDGIMYFFVLFSSNLIWLLLVLYARPSLKFIHNQPAMIVSSIMINRICLNLKKAGRQPSTVAWNVKTFRTWSDDSEQASEDRIIVPIERHELRHFELLQINT